MAERHDKPGREGDSWDPRWSRYYDEDARHRGYGSTAGGWDTDEGRVQFGEGRRGWQGPGRIRDSAERESDPPADTPPAAGYGPGGYGGYGSGEHSAQPHGPHGQHGGGYGSKASYGNQGPRVGYSHGPGSDSPPRSDRWHPEPNGPYGAQGEYAPQPSYRSRSTGNETDRRLRQLWREPWFGDGYGGPTHPVAPEPGEARWRREDVERRWPRSYTRSDDRIREDLYERIMQYDYIDASDLTVVVAQGKVTLEGTVPERHMKHHIENIADGCPGVKDIDNHIRVARGVEDHGDRTTGGAMGYTADSDTAAGIPPSTGKK